MLVQRTLLPLFSLILICISCANLSDKQNQCLKTRGAFDIGSGSTKLKVALVDTCENYIVEEIFSDSRPVSYRKSIGDSTNNSISLATLEEGIKAIMELKEESQKSGKVTDWVAVATSAFRTADNGKDMVKLLSSKTTLNIKILSQEEEAILGYYAAFSKIKTKPEGALAVWDIGGGSMQILINDSGKFYSYLGTTASVPFKEIVIEKVQRKNLQKAKSPNPLGKSNARKALEISKKIADKEVPDEIRSLLKKIPLVYGVGGVHNYSIKNQLNLNEYSAKDVEKSLILRSTLSDKELKSQYSDTEVSNLALVSGYMYSLSIQKVRPIPANLADGLLVSPNPF